MTRLAMATVAAALVLTGCSRGTLITLDLETLAVVDAASREGSLPAEDLARRELPEGGVALADAGLDGEIAGALQSLGVTIAGTLQLTAGAPDATITVAVFLGSTSDLLYALDPIASEEVFLSGTASDTFSLSVTIDGTTEGALDLLRSGDAVIGFEIEVDTDGGLAAANGASVTYVVDAIDLTASVLVADLLPF